MVFRSQDHSRHGRVLTRLEARSLRRSAWRNGLLYAVFYSKYRIRLYHRESLKLPLLEYRVDRWKQNGDRVDLWNG